HIGSSDAIVILVTVLVLHVIAANVIYPRLLGTKLRLNPLAGALALLVWGWLWGPIGLIFGIPITAGLKIVCAHVESLHAYGGRLRGPGGAGPRGSSAPAAAPPVPVGNSSEPSPSRRCRFWVAPTRLTSSASRSPTACATASVAASTLKRVEPPCSMRCLTKS